MDHPIRVHWPHLSRPCLDPEHLRTASLTFSYWSSLRYVESGFLHSRATIPIAIRFSPSIAPRAFLSEKFLPWLTHSEPSAGLPCDYIPPVSRVGGCNALRALLYIPDKRILESKSLNLYPWSCREEGEFHEHVTNRLLDDAVLEPPYCEVTGAFNVRGGISITVEAIYEKQP